uniref:USP domain-containing protein n=1 Tax=Mycena chlorophos TaxID=658473 RepID=A0ABQ0M920_MYCCL|nr:predicted protein [Mycena chlorophos]
MRTSAFLPSFLRSLRRVHTLPPTRMSLPSTRNAIGINKTSDSVDVIEKVTIPLNPGPGDIVVKTEYLGINFIDTYYRKGLYPVKAWPAVLGVEASGTIVALPTDESVLNDSDYKKRGYTVGARVGVTGAGVFGLHADYVTVPWKIVHPLPDSASTKIAAAALLQGLTVVTFVEEAYKVQKGDTILVHTIAGGLGLLFAQVLKARGATVIGTTSTKEKAELAKANGADHVILYKDEDTVARVLEITNGAGVEAVFDGVGKDTFDSNFKMLKRKGTLVSVGNASGPVEPFAPIRLAEKNFKLLRPTSGQYLQTPEELSHYTKELFALLENGLKIKIHGEYPFTAEGSKDAQKDLTGGKTTGKFHTQQTFSSSSRRSIAARGLTRLPHEMENKENAENPKPTSSRRPLPTPGHRQTPSTTSIVIEEPPVSPTARSSSTGTTSSVSSVSTYSSASGPASSAASTSSQPPALPNRPPNLKLGSSHTTVLKEPESLPSYHQTISNPFREPELVQDAGDDDMPELISTEQDGWGNGQNWYSNPFSTWQDTDFVKIDGRNYYEEDRWYEPGRYNDRPGRGILPPVLADELHSPEHSLYEVIFPTTDIQPGSTHSAASTPNVPDAPTGPEIRASIPHPDAYYCPKDHGWVIMSWGHSEMLDLNAILASSFQSSDHPPLPRPPVRNPANCVDATGNVTHHYHKYARAVDGRFLDVPLNHDKWDTPETMKQKRRVGTVEPEQLDLDKISAEEEDKMDVDEVEEGPLFDLYLCCQCSFYLVRSSDIIPAVIHRSLWEDLIKDKKANPQPGKNPERSVALAVETLLMAIENKLWKGEHRMLRVSRPGFQTKMGWNPIIQRVFETLGFTHDTFDTEFGLRPPSTDPTLPQGKQNRGKLLRAWTEISAWMNNFERANIHLIQHEYKGYPLWTKLELAREKYQLAIGAHPEQIPRTDLSQEARSNLEQLSREWRILGMTPITYSPELLAFAYFAQCRCDFPRTIEYFSALHRLIVRFNALGTDCELLEKVLSAEAIRGRISEDDVKAAPECLGFGVHGIIGVEYDSQDVDDTFIENAWRDSVKRSWRHPDGSAMQKRATAALKVLAMARRSHNLQTVWEQAQHVIMTPEQAYHTLELSPEIEMDEDTLIMIFQVRLEEATTLQKERMRQAMEVVAEYRDSPRLRKFLEFGVDPGVIVPATRSDIPRGLNQLGNTCYLNSLLQYFYTIKDLREAVMSMNGHAIKSVEDEKVTDDDLKRHRVGGRLVTRREITRSKRFISLLATLFNDLQTSEDPSVTPAVELAKLALVTSKDEEEDEDRANTDSSNDTDATLVDEGGAGAPRISTQSNAMDVDSPEVPPRTNSPVGTAEAGSSKAAAKKAAAPPLPARKAAEASGSEMMFGKQHDVSECMDNCMFQIETALLKFDAIGGTDDDNKTSVVKRLLYGKIRQRLASDDLQSRSSVHEKEDLFSHLPVNVNDDGVDIYDGLSAYFDDVVEFEGKKARMEVTLVDLPPLLQIQLQRVQFNRETLQPYKSQAYVKFGETIYMDRFLDSADPQKKARGKVIQGELTRCRERIRVLLSHKTGRCASMLDYSARFLATQGRGAGVDDALIESLRAEQKHISAEIDTLRGRIDQLKKDLEDLWRDCKDAPYELTSVFIHRGSSPSFGHYFFYSRHLPSHPDEWFKYNDSDVTMIKKSEVLADTTGSTANPYLLVFARKGSEVVDTVKRLNASDLTPIS